MKANYNQSKYYFLKTQHSARRKLWLCLIFPYAILHWGREIRSFMFFFLKYPNTEEYTHRCLLNCLVQKIRGTHRDVQLSEWVRRSPKDRPYELMGKNSLQRKIVTCQCALVLQPRHERMFVGQERLLTWCSVPDKRSKNLNREQTRSM